MEISKIIGVHSSINGSYCIDCFSVMVKPEVLMEIDRVASFNVWRNVEETYTISGYDTKLKRYVGDVVKIIRDDSEDVDRQNMDDYPQGLVCTSRGCKEIIVSRWEDDTNLIHFKNGVTEYGLVYKKGNGPIGWYYVSHNDKGEEVVLTDVMSGTDDYYEIDSMYELLAEIIYGEKTYTYNVYIHDRNDFYVFGYQTKEHIPVYQKENGWTFHK